MRRLVSWAGAITVDAREQEPEYAKVCRHFAPKRKMVFSFRGVPEQDENQLSRARFSPSPRVRKGLSPFLICLSPACTNLENELPLAQNKLALISVQYIADL